MRLVGYIRYSAAALVLLSTLFGCIGRATPPEQVKLTQQQNEVLGKFARRVGEKEINILLKDPNDPTLPGMPVGDLLYILSKVNEDKLIDLVKGIGATTTLELILAIKRVGCTRANNVPAAGAYTFDATVPLNTPINSPTTGLNYCTWKEFHLPNIMVQLLNGANTNGMQSLIDTVNHSYPTLNCASNASGKLDPNQPLCPSTSGPTLNSGNDGVYDATVSHYAFLMKLAYIVVGFDTPTSGDPNLSSDPLIGPPKLYNLMNMTIDGRDMVYLMNLFDSNACPAGPLTTSNCVYVNGTNVLTTYAAGGDLWADINAKNQLQGLQNLLDVMLKVNNTGKMGTLLNGYRGAANRFNTARDDAQIRYYTDRLKVMIEHSTTCAAAAYPGTAAEQALQDYKNPQAGIATGYTGATMNPGWNTNLAKLINYINNITNMMDLVYYIDDGFDINHVTTFNCAALATGNGRGIDNLMVMVNNLNDVAVHVNDLTGYNPPYSATAVLPANWNPTNSELQTAAYLIDNVALDSLNPNPAKRNKVKYLTQYIGDTLRVLQLACYTAVADNNPVGAGTCANRGLINQVADGSKLDDSSNTDLTAAGQKLTQMTGQITDIESMRFLVQNVSMANLSAMIKGMLISGTAKTANLVNQITGNNCWNSPAGVLKIDVSVTGAGYVSPPNVNIGAPTSTVNTNPVAPLVTMGPGVQAVAKAVIETDTLNFGGTVGQLKAVVVLDPGGGYYNTVPAPFNLAPPATGFSSGAALASATVGSCKYNSPLGSEFRGLPSVSGTGATGLGKMVNVINNVTGSPKTLVDLINNINDGQQLGILINGVGRSSNLVGVMNATIDQARKNNASINDMINLLNNISRVDTVKLVHMIDAFGNATETPTNILPGGDHDMVAQLIAPYCRSDAAGLASATCPATLGNFVHQTSGVGYATMATLVSSLSLTGGGGYADGSLVAAAGGVQGRLNVPVVNAITGTNVLNPGAGCTVVPTVTLTGGGGSGAILVPYISGGQVQKINILNSGTGYTSNPVVTFSGGGCTTTPVGEAYVNGIGTVTVLNSGTAGTYTSSFVISPGGANPGSITAVVSGGISTLNNITPGTGYVNGQLCPIIGAGGQNATCTVTAAGGSLSACALAAGNNYASGRIVKIGGQAQVVATVTAGSVTAYTIISPGCGYTSVPAVQVVGCTVAPTFTPGANSTLTAGRVTAINQVTGGSGCGTGVKVIIGETPYAYHSDGATAIVGNVSTGIVSSMSVSDASVNAAQLVQLLDRDATGTGIAFNYRNDDYAWPIKSACSSSGVGFAPLISDPPYGSLCPAGDTLRPTISTREAMIRLLHHGVTPTITSSKSYFNASMGLGGPADLGVDGLANNNQVAGTYSMDWPGIGPQHIAGAILNNVTSTSTQTLIYLMNSDTISLEDTIILLGCGDRISYGLRWTTLDWQPLCKEVGPGIW